MKASVKTIENGYYPKTLAALRSGKNANAAIAAINQEPWGSHPGAVSNSNLNINVKVDQSSDSNLAKLIAKEVKTVLSKDSGINKIGSK